MPKEHSKIVLDLEFNPIRDPELRETARQEIIEIGAVKLNDDYEIISEFDMFIKPQYNVVEPKITSITGITNEQLAGCESFNEVMYKFMDWIGDEPFSLYSWSMSDRDVMQDEIDLKYPDDTRYDRFFVHWIDLQHIYQRIMGFSKSMNLTNALGTLKIYFTGTEHGALADAKNTAEVMKCLIDSERMTQIKEHSGITYNSNTASGGFSMGNMFANCIKKPHK